MFKTRFTYLALALGLATAGACDNDKTRDNAENAADDLKDKTADLKDEAKDLQEVAKDQDEEIRDRDLERTGAARNGIVETTKDVGEVAHDRADLARDTVEDVKDESADMMKQSIATRDAQKEFEYQRMVRVQTLRAVHGITASQPMLINAIAAAEALRDADRAKINEKVNLVQLRLDESANLIQSLEGVDAEHWVDREKDVANAMNRLEDARSDAWEALDEADRFDQTSMR
jgi:hypothetical protein